MLDVVTSDCRVNKRASASLCLRLPRGRPPAVGVDSSFFNLTPPSAEALTPTKEEKVITETVEQSIVVEAKETSANVPKSIEPVNNATIVENGTTDTTERVIQNGVDKASELPTTHRILPEQTPIVTDKETPTESSPENIERLGDTLFTGERVIPVDLVEGETELNRGETDKFILAERPDYSPNPHSSEAYANRVYAWGSLGFPFINGDPNETGKTSLIAFNDALIQNNRFYTKSI